MVGGAVSAPSIIKPAPRIPGDPVGLIPIPASRLGCGGCCLYDAGRQAWDDRCDPNAGVNCSDGRLVHYIPLADAIARGVVRQGWSD